MRTIKIIDGKISRPELRELAKEIFGDMVKGTVDIISGRIALGGEMHMNNGQYLCITL
jgi:hypothetical protein